MKGLKEFLEALKENEVLRAEVEKVQDDAKKVVEIAKKNGYSFTEDEYMDAKMDAVSGGEGSFFDDVKKLGGNLMNAYNVLNGQNPTGTTQGQGAGGQGVPDGFTGVKLKNGATVFVNQLDGSSWLPDQGCQGGYRRM